MQLLQMTILKLQKIIQKQLFSKGYAEKYGWSKEKHFNWPQKQSDWKEGFACSNIKAAEPEKSGQENRFIFDERYKKWRHSTMADRFCVPFQVF